jgi:hypothetical protein
MVTAAGDEPMMPLQSYTLWSIWLYLPFLLRLFFLVLALVSFYTLFSAAVTMVRLRSLSDKRHVEDESSLHRSLAARLMLALPICDNWSALPFFFLASYSF